MHIRYAILAFSLISVTFRESVGVEHTTIKNTMRIVFEVFLYSMSEVLFDRLRFVCFRGCDFLACFGFKRLIFIENEMFRMFGIFF